MVVDMNQQVPQVHLVDREAAPDYLQVPDPVLQDKEPREEEQQQTHHISAGVVAAQDKAVVLPVKVATV
jgi:hypothetical protein